MAACHHLPSVVCDNCRALHQPLQTVPLPQYIPAQGVPSSRTTITAYPCHYGAHDFAVGATHAVCNRCEKVVELQPSAAKAGDASE